ncbi:hypothetical protein [Microbispora hainanensis]|uniref:hypothetical protein n=1 Tax=Microbispora hainanensis TaxID=568844 RepID=UPI00142E9529|nr:hypothetical protein [Microbispora hainanensis]
MDDAVDDAGDDAAGELGDAPGHEAGDTRRAPAAPPCVKRGGIRGGPALAA